MKIKIAATQKDVEIVKLEIQFTKSLARGARGDEVKQLQEILSEDFDIYPEGLVTGFFGLATEAAVKRFQEKYNIESLGTIGPKTREKLNELIAKGAGKSGVIPPGLLHAPGIQRKLQTFIPEEFSTQPSGIIPVQLIGHIGTTTALAATTTITATSTLLIPLFSPTPSSSPMPSISSSTSVLLPSSIASSTTSTSAYDAWYIATSPIYNLVVRSTSLTGAVINWNTKDPSDSEIHFATSPITSGMSFATVLAAPNGTKTFHEVMLSNLNSVTTYYFIVVAKNTLGQTSASNESSFATTASVSSGTTQINSTTSSPSPSPSASPIATTTTAITDTTVPLAPTNLAATAVYDWHITLTWSKSTDNVGVVGYKIYRNGTQIFSAATSSTLETLAYREYREGNFTAGNIYSYTVAAYDEKGNISAQSNAVSVTPVAEVISTPSPTPTVSSSPIASPSPSPSPTPTATACNSIDFEDDPQIGSNLTGNSSHIVWLNAKGLDITGAPDGYVWSTKMSGGAGQSGVVIGLSSPNHAEQDQGLSDSEILTLQFLNAPVKTVSVTLASTPSSESIVNNKSSTVVTEAFNEAGTSLASGTWTFTGITNGTYTPKLVSMSLADATIKKITLKATSHPYGGVWIEKVDFGASCSVASRSSRPVLASSVVSNLSAILTSIADILARMRK